MSSNLFQSARQIWVWPNEGRTARVVESYLHEISRYSAIVVCFNLPGRFGFGRTAPIKTCFCADCGVSICQADLGLAELHYHARGWARESARFNLPGRFVLG